MPLVELRMSIHIISVDCTMENNIFTEGGAKVTATPNGLVFNFSDRFQRGKLIHSNITKATSGVILSVKKSVHNSRSVFQ